MPAVPIAVSKLSVQEKLSFVNVMRDVHNLFSATFFTHLIFKKNQNFKKTHKTVGIYREKFCLNGFIVLKIFSHVLGPL